MSNTRFIIIIFIILIGCKGNKSGTNPNIGPNKIPGCVDNTACNHNADATEDDGSCIYYEVNYDCNANCVVEIDCAGICGGDTTQDDCNSCESGVFDCAGVCDGSTVVDACGECGGEGMIIACLDGSFVCDVADCPDDGVLNIYYDISQSILHS